MKKSTSILLLCLVVLFTAGWVVTGFVTVPLGHYDHLPFSDPKAISKGLDLSGGVYAIYKPVNDEEEDLGEKLQSAMKVLRERLDNSGYTEATVTLQGANQIRIEIPSLKNYDEVLKLIGEPAKLEFVDPDGNVILGGENVEKAFANVMDGKNVVSFKLDATGTTLFSEATARLLNKTISIQLDGKEISAPTVSTHISGGEGYIEGSFKNAAEAEQLAALIQSGALPLELEQIEVRTISATLGDTALSTSLLAGLIGFCILLVFMVVVYRVPGIVADLSLIIYLMIVVTCVSEFKIQLTLPGIAGIILGVGMAVDANVIIYERIKEEMTLGRPLVLALQASYKKATVTILDSNTTTIIAAIVLATVGAGSIKGFAYTLILSIIASMFTALVLSRLLLKLLAGINLVNPKLYGISKKRLENPQRVRSVPVMRYAKWLAIAAAVIIAAGGVVTATAGVNLGIDFTGGTIYTINAGEKVDAGQIEQIARKYISGDLQVAVSDETLAVIRYQDKEAEAEAQEKVRADILAEVQTTYPKAAEENLERVGAVAGEQLTNSALLSLGIAVALMLVYIWIRFELLSGVAAIIVLVHDVLIMAAVMVFTRTQVNSNFIAAMLTIVGYSINNTIVIFDRIRDNKRVAKNIDRHELVNRSIGESMGRTINTTVTTLIMIVFLYCLGVTSVKDFSLPIIVGLLAGFYSATFLSAPIWAWLSDLHDRNHAKRVQKKLEKHSTKKKYVGAVSKKKA